MVKWARQHRHMYVIDVDTSHARRPADIQCELHPTTEWLITVNSWTNIAHIEFFVW